MMTLHEISEAEARANAATPGPWIHERLLYSDGTPYSTHYLCWRFVEPSICGLWDGCDKPESADADFIAAARTDVPALCATARKSIELLRMIDKAQEQYDCIDVTLDAVRDFLSKVTGLA